MLRRIDYGESDQVIKVFLKETGNISAIAKGIKRSKKRFPHRLEPFRVYDFKFEKRKPGQRLSLIRSADQRLDFEGIHKDIRRIALGNFILELILISVKEGHPHPDLYAFTLKAFHTLNEADDIFPLWFYLSIHLMRLLGFSPNFETCSQCGLSLDPRHPVYFNPAGGGLLCGECGPRSRAPLRAASSETLGVLRFLKLIPIQAASRVRISNATCHEIETFLTEFTTFHLERPLKSLPFLQESLASQSP